MNPREAKVEEFLQLTDDELLDYTNVMNTPSGNLAKAVLQHRLSKNIEKLDKSTGLYSKAIGVLTTILIVLAIEQLLITIFPPKGIVILIYILPDVALAALAIWLLNKTLDLR